MRALTLLTIIATLTTPAADPAPATEYPKTFIVFEIDRTDDIIYLMDANGNEWIYEGCEDWQTGDVAAATMNDNGTPSIYDDTIEKLHYSGWNVYEE